MADYSQINDYSAKDALATGNPLKLIKGSDIDAELSAIATAISSKFDSTDVASAGEAQAGVSNTVVITPARLTAWAQNGGGLVEDIQALADPGGDRILFWDDSANAVTYLSAGTGINITGTTITVDEAGFSGRSILTSEGLTGGGDLSADRTLTLDFAGLTAATIAAADIVAFEDVTDNTHKRTTLAGVNAVLDHDTLSGFVADEHVAHSAVTLTAGEGLSGGGTIAASRSFAFDYAGLTEETTIDPTNDLVVFYDDSASAHRKVAADAFLGTELGDGKFYRGSAQALTANTEATVVFNTTAYNSLQRGSYNGTTGEYTAGSEACRVLVTANCTIESIDEANNMFINIQVNGVDQAFYTTTGSELASEDMSIAVTSVLSLSASDVVRVRMETTSNENILGGVDKSYISIVELA